MNRQNRKFLFNIGVLLFWRLLAWCAAYFIFQSYSKSEWFGVVYYMIVMIYSSNQVIKTHDKIEETFKRRLKYAYKSQ